MIWTMKKHPLLTGLMLVFGFSLFSFLFSSSKAFAYKDIYEPNIAWSQVSNAITPFTGTAIYRGIVGGARTGSEFTILSGGAESLAIGYRFGSSTTWGNWAQFTTFTIRWTISNEGGYRNKNLNIADIWNGQEKYIPYCSAFYNGGAVTNSGYRIGSSEMEMDTYECSISVPENQQATEIDWWFGTYNYQEPSSTFANLFDNSIYYSGTLGQPWQLAMPFGDKSGVFVGRVTHNALVTYETTTSSTTGYLNNLATQVQTLNSSINNLNQSIISWQNNTAQQDQQDRNNVSDTSNESQQDGQDASSDANTATSSLLGVITGVYGVLLTPHETDCVISGVQVYEMNLGNLDFCTGFDIPQGLFAIGALVMIGLIILLAWSILRAGMSLYNDLLGGK